MRSSLAILLGATLASGIAMAGSDAKFSELDADGNGKLNETEATEAGIDLTALDADGNGVVSKEEYQAAVKAMEEEG